jgi:hypothetical protein
MEVREAFRTPNRQEDQKRSSPYHIIIKTLGIQNKERIMKAARENSYVTCLCKLIRITADFSTETLKARKAWNDIFQAMKENNCQPRLLYSVESSFIIEGEIKTLYVKQNLI